MHGKQHYYQPSLGAFVFLREQEPDEVLVAHLPRWNRLISVG